MTGRTMTNLQKTLYLIGDNSLIHNYQLFSLLSLLVSGRVGRVPYTFPVYHACQANLQLLESFIRTSTW